MKMRDIQAELARLGYTPGPIDGVWGRRTAEAVRAFQARHGLEVDGVVGPLTLAKLIPSAPPPSGRLDDPTLTWLQEARRLLGLQEVRGGGSNPDIIFWADAMGITYRSDDIPWCGLFVGHCISATLDRETIPGDLLRARAWEKFGIPVGPTVGAIMVFWRRTRESGLGHVGFYVGEDDGAYRIIGGNQSDSVSLAWVEKSRLVAARWPATIPPRPPQRPTALRDEHLSRDEA